MQQTRPDPRLRMVLRVDLTADAGARQVHKQLPGRSQTTLLGLLTAAATIGMRKPRMRTRPEGTDHIFGARATDHHEIASEIRAEQI